jgi:hypothetical protein
MPDKKLTNYDRIRNMSVEELAQLLNKCDCDYPPYCKNPFGCGHFCIDCAKVWLESEVDNNG